MAIISATSYQEATNQSITGSALTALQWACGAVDAAVKRVILPFLPEPQTVTNAVLDAPPSNELQLPYRPVRSITSLYLNPDASGDPTAFTPDDLLANYTDYYLPVDVVTGYNRAGIVLRRGVSVWGREFRRLPDRLADTSGAAPGAILCTFAAGTTSVDDSLFLAAQLAVTKVRLALKFGTQVTSASLNGASYSLPAAAVQGVLQDPTIASLLLPFQTINFAAG